MVIGTGLTKDTIKLSIASAPVSWGITESVEFPPNFPYTRVLDEIRQAGYAGTELGPYGFLPAHAATLREELERRDLVLCSAFVAMPLGDESARKSGLAHVERTARLISQVGCRLLILSDEVSEVRSRVAGRPAEANRLSWSGNEWDAAEKTIREAINLCRNFGLEAAFHHHVGTHVETPEEVASLFSLFSSEDLGLCLDTGHCVYGGGNPKVLLEQYAGRVRCVHLKDIDAARLRDARQKDLDFYTAVRHGVFAPLGQGTIDFPTVLAALDEYKFKGWAVVEQDVLAGGEGASTPLANAIAGHKFLQALGY